MHQHNLLRVMRGARARWKIENETFNTLKNQGYHFEHNFGHGYRHLSTVFAHLMAGVPGGPGADLSLFAIVFAKNDKNYSIFAKNIQFLKIFNFSIFFYCTAKYIAFICKPEESINI